MQGLSPQGQAAQYAGSTLEACRRGDRHALESVFRSEASALERLIARLVGNHADVEDLLQTTLIEAIGAFPRYRGEASVRAWLTGIAVHVVHAHFRHPERKRKVALELITEPTDAAPRADARVHSRRQLESVNRYLDRLSPKNRIAFILHVFLGYPIEEVAALVGASRVATKSRVFLARRALLSSARNDPILAEWFSSSSKPIEPALPRGEQNPSEGDT
jgi:RNA polymerase sigma-70 factor (ECF subfamily)